MHMHAIKSQSTRPSVIFALVFTIILFSALPTGANSQTLQDADALVEESGSIEALLTEPYRSRYAKIMKAYYGLAGSAEYMLNFIQNLNTNMRNTNNRLMNNSSPFPEFTVQSHRQSYGRTMDEQEAAKFGTEQIKKLDTQISQVFFRPPYAEEALPVLLQVSKQIDEFISTNNTGPRKDRELRARDFFEKLKADPTIRAHVANLSKQLYNEYFDAKRLMYTDAAESPDSVLENLENDYVEKKVIEGMKLPKNVLFLFKENFPTFNEILTNEKIFPPILLEGKNGAKSKLGRSSSQKINFVPLKHNVHAVFQFDARGNECIANCGLRAGMVAVHGAVSFQIEVDGVNRGYMQLIPYENAQYSNQVFYSVSISTNVLSGKSTFTDPETGKIVEMSYVEALLKNLPKGFAYVMGDDFGHNEGGVLLKKQIGSDPGWKTRINLGSAKDFHIVDPQKSALEATLAGINTTGTGGYKPQDYNGGQSVITDNLKISKNVFSFTDLKATSPTDFLNAVRSSSSPCKDFNNTADANGI